jgi:ribonuclease T1
VAVRRILRDRRTFAAALVVMVVVSVVIGWLRGADGSGDAGEPSATPTVVVTEGPPTGDEPPEGEDTESAPAFPTAVAPSAPVIDPESGLQVVDLVDLPPEAADTVALIDAGGPFPYDTDGVTFLNSDGYLPDREDGYYLLYTVDTPGSESRGPLRIVSGTGGEFYWTDDRFESFRRIER